MTFTVGSLYAGIGGIDKGMKQAGFQISWANEFDEKACETYRMNHTSSNLIEEDIYQLNLTNLPKVDVLAAGFPCQPFSVAGYRKGFADERGNHFMRIMEIVDVLKPTVIFLENVKNFKNHDKKRTYEVMTREIMSRGYWFKDTIMNTADYGNIPQNRERFFLIAFNNEKMTQKFRFPGKMPLITTIHDFIDHEKVEEKFYYTSKSVIYERIVDEIVKRDTLYQWRRKYVRENKSKMCPTLTANMGTGGHNVPLLLTSDGIRKLTPLECFRFQGFYDIRFPEDISASHLYKQAGNSVSVPVIQRIAENIMTVLERSEKDKLHVTREIPAESD